MTTAMVVACGGSGGASNEAARGPATAVAEVPTRLATAAVSPTPAPLQLNGFVYPIAGGCLPAGDQLMPNAPRPYRNGVHEGVDFYGSDNCTSITRGTPVVAAKAGRIVRADLDFRDFTPAELTALLVNPNTEQALDKFRGRQVWVDHGGVIARYCHLEAVAAGITVGSSVTQGQLIAYVGESGTPESITNPGHEYHLHFEVRLPNGAYLGEGMSVPEVRTAYQALFAPLR